MTLGEQQELFARMVPSLILQAFEMGYTVRLGEAWRTPEQAAWNAAHGTGIVHSLHIDRLAIDLLLFKDGVYLTDTESYRPLGVWWIVQHALACWGGDWGDGNHFSLMRGGVK